MKKRVHIPSFLSGILVSVLAAALVLPVMAARAGKNVTIYPGVSVYVDDQLIEPKDANGNPVEVFIYNGTTYLPIRAVGSALGKAIDWDGSTYSAYVGRHASNQPAVWLKDLDYFYESGIFYVSDMAVEDNYGESHNNCIYSARSSNYINDVVFSRIYNLNGNYSRITGTTFIPYEHRSRELCSNSGIEIYGDGELIYANRISGNTKMYSPISFDVDLTGVLQLEIKYYNYYSDYNDDYARLYLGDCGLWT